MKNMPLPLFVALGGLLLWSYSGFAEDLMPPAWRGQSGTTFTKWTFSTSNSWLPPEVYSNPVGAPGGMVSPGTEWHELWGSRQGVWSFGSADIGIPPTEPKDYRFQLTWAAKNPGGYPSIALSATAHTLSELQLEPTGEAPPFGQYGMHTTLEFRVLPGYEFPWFTVGGDIMIDEMIVDTIVPEPGVFAICLLGVCAFAIRGR